MAAMIMVSNDVPNAASKPNARAMGAPHKIATVRSRRAWSVPNHPATFPWETNSTLMSESFSKVTPLMMSL